MVILKKYEHPNMGEICCIGEDENTPICWMKKQRIKAFSSEYEDVEIMLDFNCFDINFERKGSPYYLKLTEHTERDVVCSYHELLKGTEELEKEFIRWYNSCEFTDEYYPYFKEEDFNEELPVVEKIEDIFPYIEEKSVCVYFNGFGVALKLKFGWMSIMIIKTNIFDEDGGYAYTSNIDVAPIISMDC